MKMSHENVLDSEARAVTHHLALRSLATIEKEGVPLPLKGDRTHVAAHRRSGRGGPEKCDSNHGSSRSWGGVGPLKAVGGVQWAALRLPRS